MPSKILKITGLVCFILLAIEGLLTVIGFSFFHPHKEDFDPKNDENKIRILALGESTTDVRTVEKKAWPEILEETLRKEGHDVSVYNRGKSGTNSSLILSALPGYMELYRPHIVISMMGINDNSAFKYDYSQTSFKLLRFIYLLRERISSRFSCKLNSDPKIIPGKTFADWANRDVKDLPEIEKEIEAYSRASTDVSTALAWIGWRKRKKWPDDRKSFEPFFQRAFELDPLNDENAKLYLSVLSSLRDPACLKISKAISECAANLDDRLLTLIADCHWFHKSPLDLSTFRNRGLSVIYGNKSRLSENYVYLARTIKDSGAELVAVQYPTLPLDALKSHFENSGENVVFVSNEENFQRALQKGKFEDFFSDNFRGSWGHPTERGHSLIAQEIANVLKPMILKRTEK